MSLLRDNSKLRCRRERGGKQRHKPPPEKEEGTVEDLLVRCAEGINKEVEEKSGEDRGTTARPDMMSSRQLQSDRSKGMSRDTHQRHR